MAEQSRESLDHSGMVCVAMDLLEVDISDFLKNQIQELQEGGRSKAVNGMRWLRPVHHSICS
jgi:hypothetical protein